ncbi:hypothetical protein AQJ11_02785 [Streptomyces corchorusii]|uniref:Lipoprotein n=2 Tax=Streptomyces TaxID=1883 RepID=A0A101QMA8_STRCK|nr:hypothetical protein [Streptomyces corchorusii]KUN32468.1 hypothetical protein AQJ11_02785 [Streptomyces corchorusii]
MKTLIAAAGALVLVGALVAAGCEPADDGDCDARGPGIELTAMHASKASGKHKPTKVKRSSRSRRAGHGHHDDCD